MPAQVLLINRETVERYFQLSEITEQDAKNLDTQIANAQALDVAPVIGRALYTWLLSNVADAKTVALIDGGEYQNERGETIRFEGLGAAIAYYAMARRRTYANAQDTAFGLVTKSTQFSTPVDDKKAEKIAIDERNAAAQFLDDAVCFLETKRTDYPLYKGQQRESGGGFYIKSVSRI